MENPVHDRSGLWITNRYRESDWNGRQIKSKTMREIKEINSPVMGSKAYAMGECRIIVARNIYGTTKGLGPARWHLSISCANRYPTWDEIHDARYQLLPDDCIMAIILPPKEEYVNLHPNCFHLHEIIE
jgi:hypothetical protein